MINLMNSFSRRKQKDNRLKAGKEGKSMAPPPFELKASKVSDSDKEEGNWMERANDWFDRKPTGDHADHDSRGTFFPEPLGMPARDPIELPNGRLFLGDTVPMDFGRFEKGDEKCKGLRNYDTGMKLEADDGGKDSLYRGGNITVANLGLEGSLCEDSFALHASANLGEVYNVIGKMDPESDKDRQIGLGLAAGASLGIRGDRTDHDNDQVPMYSGGFDFGPLMLDYKTEDPIGDLKFLRNFLIPGMMPISYLR